MFWRGYAWRAPTLAQEQSHPAETRCILDSIFAPRFKRRRREGAPKLALNPFCGRPRAPLIQGWPLTSNALSSIRATSRGRSSMADVDACRVEFQCPHCRHELEQTIGRLKSQNHMSCPGCGIGICVDADRLANVVEEIRKAVEKVPPEITIKFYR